MKSGRRPVSFGWPLVLGLAIDFVHGDAQRPWDSSAILALLDRDDADHARAVAVAHQIVSEAFTFDHHFRQYGRIRVLGLDR